MKKYIFLVLALLLSLQINAKSNTKTIDNILNKVFDKDGPGGVAFIVKDGKTFYRKAFGMANIELDVKMTPDFIFRVGSVTKQFTAAAIIQLAEQGKIDLTADIREYLKDFQTQDQKITIEHLLTHTSGIMIDTATNDLNHHMKMQDLNSSEMVDLIKGQPFTMVAGENYEYSNANYMLLGRIIEILFIENDDVYVQVTGNEKDKQIAISEFQFASVAYDISLTINLDENEQVENLTMHYYGDHLAKKVE